MGMAPGARPEPKPKPVVGYIEPVPEFYQRLLDLTKDTNKMLTDYGVLDESSKYRLNKLEEIIKKVLELSKQELDNKELTEEDYDFIKNFGENISGTVTDVGEAGIKTTLIADVHTDSNSQQVLEEGGGYIKLLLVAYDLPDGRKLFGAGPIMTYYEFKHPMADRLTDEKWREMLETGEPKQPEWVKTFTYSK